MDMEMILKELDRLFATYQMDKVEGFLENKMAQAASVEDDNSLITLLNEMIGYLRDVSKYEKCCMYCDRLLNVLEKNGLKGTIPYATSLLNIANAYRAAGLLAESMTNYKTVCLIYQSQLEDNDFRFASLYNNMSLLYQEMGEFEEACVCLEKALSIVKNYEEARIETAVTHTNLAASQLKLGQVEAAMGHLKAAFSIFEMDEQKDFHYSGALSAMGEAQYMAGNLEESARYYRKALAEIEKNTGRSSAYEIVSQNLNEVEKQMEQRPGLIKRFKKGLDLCEAFYHEYGEPMLREKFPSYMPYIAAGLVGEGSECFGFDDEISLDHDYGPGFCLFLTDSIYEEIGEALQTEYDKLPLTYMGITRRVSPKAPKRVGVFRIGEFYERLTGLTDIPASHNQWLYTEDYRLAAATNGRVFADTLGEFTRIRKGLLAHYPEEVRIRKIAREAALIAQSGQYNYSRMLRRGDKVTAQVALGEFMKHTMSIVYLLNRKYAPFYKWMHKGMENLHVLAVIGDILNAIADMQIGDERIPQTIEIIVTLIIDEMKKQSLTTGSDNYLDHHTDNILHSITQNDTANTTVREELIDRLIGLEWQNFDLVKNIGGRADCQDDWNTFSIMRRSQYLTWTIPMLQSYIEDFERAQEEGWNLIAEKYGRMMESTDPEGYRAIQDRFPYISPEKKEIIEEIVKIQISWMEECAREYPKAAAAARSIHTDEDSLYNTSYETYLRGEISTYSDRTLDLYGRFIATLCQDGKNLAKMTIDNSAKLYGYASLEELEIRL
jgi:tetratricopeptide (TPR) repeat protein